MEVLATALSYGGCTTLVGRYGSDPTQLLLWGRHLLALLLASLLGALLLLGKPSSLCSLVLFRQQSGSCSCGSNF